MTITTAFTELVGCPHPIQNAGMGTASPALGAAVARAGALGMISGALLSPETLENILEDSDDVSPGCLGVNFLIPFLEDRGVIDIAARFSVMWPDAPHRVLKKSLDTAETCRDEIVGQATLDNETIDIPRFSVMCPFVGASGNIEAMAQYAGQSVGSVDSVKPAAEIVTELAQGAERLLSRQSPKGTAV